MKIYPIAQSDRRYLPSALRQMPMERVKCRTIGEFRCPKKGEGYLSGAIIEAYYAPNDLSTQFHIAKLVKVEKITTGVIIP